jgi:mRNA (2'-O-methyladenosine-N6-)-methyltransferase
LKKIKVGEIADSPSFIFLWAGTEHLEDARELLK